MTYMQKLDQPIDAIIFDCDGTLSTIEGIDELAASNGVGAEVSRLTEQAMGRTGLSLELYEQRLNLVQPNRQQVCSLGQVYFDHHTPDIVDVIKIFQSLNKSIYIVSAGLQASVESFAKLLNIPTENVFAVDITFDENGKYLDFDRSSPMTTGNGKRIVVQALQAKHPRLGYVGDGLNDIAVMDIVTRFVGYGGTYYRENIKALCEFYITDPSMRALLTLFLTEEECRHI